MWKKLSLGLGENDWESSCTYVRQTKAFNKISPNIKNEAIRRWRISKKK